MQFTVFVLKLCDNHESSSTASICSLYIKGYVLYSIIDIFEDHDLYAFIKTFVLS